MKKQELIKSLKFLLKIMSTTINSNQVTIQEWEKILKLKRLVSQNRHRLTLRKQRNRVNNKEAS